MSVMATYRDIRDSLKATEQEFYLAYKECCLEELHWIHVEPNAAYAKAWHQNGLDRIAMARVRGITGKRLNDIIEMANEEASDEIA